MSSGFESVFKKLVTPPRSAKTRGQKPERLDLGSTEGGKAQFKPVEPVREDTKGGLNICEIPASRGHASKAHRGRKQVHKVGVSWR